MAWYIFLKSPGPRPAPLEVLEVGQEVKVKVINIDREKKAHWPVHARSAERSLASKVDKFKVGQLVEGIITRLTKFGAFARLEGDLEGLIPPSEISETKSIPRERPAMHEGATRFTIILGHPDIGPDQRRIG